MPIEPLRYVYIIVNILGVLADSGGMHEESFIIGARYATLRENTGWPETFIEKRNHLVGLTGKRPSKRWRSRRLMALQDYVSSVR